MPARHHNRHPVPARTHRPDAVLYLPNGPYGQLTPYTPAELAAHRRQDQILHARWVQRQAAIAAHDRKVRGFWTGLGTVVGLALIAGCALGGWLISTRVDAGTVLAVLALAAVTVPAAVIGGHRCITTVTHRH